MSRLVTSYCTDVPLPSISAQRVVFGTSGHRGCPFKQSFNEWHVLAISQAICRYRKRPGIDGPLFLGIDTHEISVPAYTSALEELAANGVEIMIVRREEYTPTPARCRRRSSSTTTAVPRGLPMASSSHPSHNPHEDGGFKCNPPNGGPADGAVTAWIGATANGFLEHK